MQSPGIDVSVFRDLRPLLPTATVSEQGPESVTELAEFVSWFNDAVTRIGQPGIAWQLGQRCDYRRRGLLGEVVMNAGTLGTGLYWLCKFYPLIQDATSVKLEVDEDTARLSYRILDPTIWPRHHDALYTLGTFSKLIRTAAPDVWPEVRIWLEASQRDFQSDLSRVVQAPVTYDALGNTIFFPARVLNIALRGSSRIDQAHIKQLSQLLTRKNRAMPVVDRARYVILADLCESQVSQAHVARELGLSSRTLRRKLAIEGVSYQELLDECRMQMATREFASAPKVSLSQMALKLGYSEHSTFTRAFSRWSGMAPREYRNTHADHGVRWSH